MEGFIVLDFRSRWADALAHMARLLAEAKLKTRFTVVDGVENAPKAMGMLFSGGNVGKT